MTTATATLINFQADVSARLPSIAVDCDHRAVIPALRRENLTRSCSGRGAGCPVAEDHATAAARGDTTQMVRIEQSMYATACSADLALSTLDRLEVKRLRLMLTLAALGEG